MVLDAGQKARSSEQLQQFLTIPHSFLAQLAGLIDGAGYIAITKTTKGYISISLRPEAPSFAWGVFFDCFAIKKNSGPFPNFQGGNHSKNTAL